MPELDALVSVLPDDTLFALAGPELSETVVRRVEAVDSIEELRRCNPGSLVLVPRYCCQLLTSFELDVAVRHAADRGLAAVVLMGSDRLPVTVRALADRNSITVLGTAEDESIVTLIRHLDHILGQQRAATLERAQATLEMLKSASIQLDHRELLARTGRMLNSVVELTWFSGSDEIGEPVVVAGNPIAWLTAGDATDAAVAVTLPALAAMLSQRYERAALEDEVRGDVLASVLEPTSRGGDRHLQSATTVGLALNAHHHVAVVIARERQDGNDVPHRASTRQERMLLTVAVRELLEPRMPGWTVAPVEQDLAVVWTQVDDPRSSEALFDAAISEVTAIVAAHLPQVDTFVGVASGAEGLQGARAALVQARAAARWARSRDIVAAPTRLAGSPVNQILGDALSSPLSQRALKSILDPIDSLPENQRHSSVLTLCTYLEAQGSNRRAAVKLHLHPNAVAYRINKIVKVLAVDFTDSDTRLMLHLACRLWLLNADQDKADRTDEPVEP